MANPDGPPDLDPDSLAAAGQNPTPAEAPRSVAAEPAVERALEELQRLVQASMQTNPEPGQRWERGMIPDDLCGDGGSTLVLFGAELDALEGLRDALTGDARLEHLDEKQADAAAWRFASLAHFRRDESHVDEFLSLYARPVLDLTCFFPVEDLKVASELEAYGVRFIPADEAYVPQRIMGPHPSATIASVIAVDGCSGTNYDKMASRARHVALHALRVLRVMLREDRFIHERQLRFRLGESVWFSDSASGWATNPEQAWGYELRHEALKVADPPPVATLPAEGRTDVEQAASRALAWFEQAQLATVPLMELLYLFFALEAILGDTGSDKARPLALRRAILGLKTTGYFTHPARTYLYYSRVRSTAVHGGDPPDVPRDEVVKFAGDIRQAINEFLRYARDHGITEQTWVVKALDRDEHRAELDAQFLRAQ
jgi:hypothetical protein